MVEQSPMRFTRIDSQHVSEGELYGGEPAPVILLTGLSGAGKTTLCLALARELRDRRWLVAVLDGDDLRQTVCADLGFSRMDRQENLRRIGRLARELADESDVVLIAAIAPYRESRATLRESLSRYLEVYVNAPLEVCIARDPKGLYRKALAGGIPGFTGIGDDYEAPTVPEVECRTDRETVQACVDKIAQHLMYFQRHSPMQVAER